jgi:hypothetical protein
VPAEAFVEVRQFDDFADVEHFLAGCLAAKIVDISM